MINTTIKDYTFKSELGQGGMANVYLAQNNAIGKAVAIKVLNKEFVYNDNIRKRFVAEAKNMMRMNHPNIIKVSDLIDQDGMVAFVMEYVEAQTLKDYLETSPKLSDDEIKNIFVQMLDALSYVHEQGLIHRDVKPSNFMISKNGSIKLLDFGIAKNTDKQSAEYTQTGTAQNMGTPMYMSPEQVKSTKDVTALSDIYSLGVVLWQMVMGKKPYDSATLSTFDLQMKIVQEDLSLTNTVWDEVIKNAVYKTVNKRYVNCASMKRAVMGVTPNMVISGTAAASKVSFSGEANDPKDITKIEPVTGKAEKQSGNPVSSASSTSVKKKGNPLLIPIIIGCVLLVGGLIFRAANGGIGERRVEEAYAPEVAPYAAPPAAPATSYTPQEPPAEQQQQLQQEQQQRQYDEANNRRDEFRNNWKNYITIRRDRIAIDALGGIDPFTVYARNETDYTLDEVKIEVNYIKDNGGIFKTGYASITNIPPHTTRSGTAPGSGRGSSVSYSIYHVSSQEMQLNYYK